ncbi:MAG TPA: DUF6152 family protein [Burkholderiales bacterium]
MRAANVLALFAVLAFAAVDATPAFAHHGWSNYDSSAPVALTGTVTELSYAYPHATIRLDVAGKSWLAVLAPPSRLSARGIGSADIKVGAQASVEGYPNRDDPAEMRAERIILGGKVYELR